MDDLADQIDDFICSFEGGTDLTMDTLAMLIFCWSLIALFLVWLGKFVYHRYIKKTPTGEIKSAEATAKKTDGAEKTGEVQLENGGVGATAGAAVVPAVESKIEAKVVQKKRSGNFAYMTILQKHFFEIKLSSCDTVKGKSKLLTFF